MPVGSRAVLLALAGFSALAGLSAPAVRSAAEEKFEPIPAPLKPKYRFNFERNFFPSPLAEREGRQKLDATLTSLEGLKGKVARSPANLLRTLQLMDRATAQLYPLTIYFYYRYAVNTKDEKSDAEQSALWARFNKRTSFVRTELIRLDEKTRTRYVAQEPRLKPYAHYLHVIGRQAPHTLSAKEEELLITLAPLAGEWQQALYQKALDRTAFGTVRGGAEDLDVRQQEQEWANSPDRSVRETGFKKLYAGYAAHRDLYAFELSRLVRARNQLSQLRRFQDSPSEAYFGLFLTSQEVKGLLQQLAAGAELNKRYERLRAARVKNITGYPEVHAWDINVVPAGFKLPRFTIDETSRILRESLAPLGPEYGEELAALLNPENGRMDIVGGESRVPGANAWGFAGKPPSLFYTFNYEGYFDDVDALTHEAGHAVHYQLMGKNRVLPVYVDSGPSYLFEAFATLNELLTTEYLYRNERDPQRRIYFLEQFLRYAMATFGNARNAAMEQAFYEASLQDRLSSPEDFDTLTRRVGERFSIWQEKHDELKMRWIAVHHFHDSPMYNVNYVYASLLALKFYEMYSRSPEGFRPKYLALLRNGFDAPPSVLLKRYLGMDMKDPNLAPGALSVLEAKVKELEALYAQP